LSWRLSSRAVPAGAGGRSLDGLYLAGMFREKPSPSYLVKPVALVGADPKTRAASPYAAAAGSGDEVVAAARAASDEARPARAARREGCAMQLFAWGLCEAWVPRVHHLGRESASLALPPPGWRELEREAQSALRVAAPHFHSLSPSHLSSRHPRPDDHAAPAGGRAGSEGGGRADGLHCAKWRRRGEREPLAEFWCDVLLSPLPCLSPCFVPGCPFLTRARRSLTGKGRTRSNTQTNIHTSRKEKGKGAAGAVCENTPLKTHPSTSAFP